MTNQFSGKRVWVTGAAGGIGKELVIQLRIMGATVAPTDLQESEDSELGKIYGVDVTVPSAIREFLDESRPFDVVFVNAGVFSMGPVEEIPADEWLRIFQVNVLGAAETARQVYKRMKESGRGGRIIFTNSLAGQTCGTTSAAYAASKWAITGLTETMAIEGAHFGIQVQSFCPGFVDTPMADPFNGTGKFFGVDPVKLRAMVENWPGPGFQLPKVCVAIALRKLQTGQRFVHIQPYVAFLARLYRFWPRLARWIAGFEFRRARDAGVFDVKE